MHVQNLKSAEEMEEEEKEAQSAKLQELIRRGTPEDLREANRLMKVMAGYDTRSKTDYRAKAAEEVAKIQAKARLLEERLEAFRPGDKMSDGDVFSELASALQSAQPKIQKMCEEESDDHDAVARLLEINDSIHRTVERYKLIKKGDVEGAAKIAAGSLIPSGPAKTPSSSGDAANELSLIDFDADAANDSNGIGNNQNHGAPAGITSQASGLENDLLGLDIGSSSSNFGQGGNIVLGFGANQSKYSVHVLKLLSSSERSLLSKPQRLTLRLIDIPGPALLSSMTQDNSASGNVSNQTPSFSQFASFTSPAASQPGTPQPAVHQQPKPPSYQPASDPFAAVGPASALASAPTPPPQPAAVSNDDDEWNFSSSLPPAAPNKPKEHKGTINQGLLRTDFLAGRATSASNSIHITFAFSNNSAQPITELHFQLAVTKVSRSQSKPLALVESKVKVKYFNYANSTPGLRATTQATNWPRSCAQAESRRHPRSRHLARRQPRTESRLSQAEMARHV